MQKSVYLKHVVFFLQFWVALNVWSKNCLKNGVPPDSNTTLFQCQEAPGEAASRAHCSDKKQLLEQQLKQCSRFLQKKVDWAQNWHEKLIGLLNVYRKLNGLLKLVDCSKVKQM